MPPASPLLHDLGHACVVPLPRASSGSSLHPSWEDSVTTRSWLCHNWHVPTHGLTTATEKHRTPCCVLQHPATPGQGSVTQFPHFSKEATPPHALGRQLWCREGGRGQAVGGGQIHASVHPSVHPPWREGGRFAKPGKIPERRGRAREGPYMGMGTASCFPADVCAAAPAPPRAAHGRRAPRQHHCHHRAQVPPLSPPLSLGAGGDLDGCRSLPGRRSSLPWHSSAHSPPHHLPGDMALPSTSTPPRYPHIHPSVPTSVSPISMISPGTLHPSPSVQPFTPHQPPYLHPYFSPLPPYPVHLGFLTGGFPRTGQRGSWPGTGCVGGQLGGQNKGSGQVPRGVNMGTKGKMLPICSCGTGSRARSHESGGHWVLSSISRAGGGSAGGGMQLPAFWGQAYLPTPKYPGGAGVKREGLQVDKRLLLLYAKPPPHMRPPCRPYNNKPACESAGRLPGRRSPSLGAGPKELCRRPLALAPCTHPPAAHPSASWPH